MIIQSLIYGGKVAQGAVGTLFDVGIYKKDTGWFGYGLRANGDIVVYDYWDDPDWTRVIGRWFTPAMVTPVWYEVLISTNSDVWLSDGMPLNNWHPVSSNPAAIIRCYSNKDLYPTVEEYPCNISIRSGITQEIVGFCTIWLEDGPPPGSPSPPSYIPPS